MSIPVTIMVPNASQLRILWERFNSARAMFDDSLPTDPIGFVTWLAATDTQTFLLGDPNAPDGAFIISGIVPGDAAFSHVFIWGRDKYAYKDLVEAARVTLAAVFTAHGLRRVLGLTPVTNLPARAFAEAVGFEVQGRLRHAVLVGGLPTDAWISDIVQEDIRDILGKGGS